MPDLVKSLNGRDLGHLRIIADLWGIDVQAPDLRSTLRRLVLGLLDRTLVEEVVSSLPLDSRAALEDLLQHDGKLPRALFNKRHGMMREMGPARRDREKPYLNPNSPAEILWYRALIARAFFDTPAGPEEFIFIPDDLLPLLPSFHAQPAPPLGRVASPTERAFPVAVKDRLVDHACTLLAALRLGWSGLELAAVADWKDMAIALPAATLQRWLDAAGLLEDNGAPAPEPARLFLEMKRGEALALLARTWLNSVSVNDLRLLPGLRAEGEWQNDPLRTRQSVLDFLATVPGLDDPQARPFWSLAAFVDAIHRQYPDFQRPAGDYSSWYIRREASEEYLLGFEHWDDVDGALVRYLLCGPLHWLGISELAYPEDPKQNPEISPSAFRFSPWAAALLRGQAPEGLPVEQAALQVRSDGRIVAPRLAPRAVRYQIARFCIWEKETPDAYQYQITPASLQRARQQGLTPNHLLSLLRKYAQTTAPSLVRSIERWERSGTEARFDSMVVLRLSNPELLQTLRASRAARFLGDPLGPAAVIVKPGAVEKVIAALAEMGYLAEVNLLGVPGSNPMFPLRGAGEE